MNYVVLYSAYTAPGFIKNNIQAKRYFFDSIMPIIRPILIKYLKKGGFIFGEDLYKNIRLKTLKLPVTKIKVTTINGKKKVETVTNIKTEKSIFFDIYFEDTNNEGCEYILQQIKKTGLLNRDVFVKNKCLHIP